MVQSPVTFNAHINYISLPQLVTDTRRLNPTTLLAYLDGGLTEGAFDLNHPVRLLQRDLPNTRIFVRAHHNDDHQFHVKVNGKYRMSPDEFLAKWGWLGKQGRTLQVMNEPSGHNEHVDDLIAWCEDIIPKATAQGISLALPAFAVQHPLTSGIEWLSKWDRVLTLLSLHNQYANLHEYGPDYAHDLRMGRFQYLINRCRRLGITPPRIYISEWGLDSLPDEKPGMGFRARGYSGAGYLQYLVDKYKQHYAAYVRQGIIAGLSIFSYGDSGGWHDFNVATDGDFMQGLPAFQVPEAVPQLNFNPKKATNPLQTNLQNGWRKTAVAALPTTTLNVRKQPSTSSDIVGSVSVGTPVEVLNGWARVRLQNGVEGFIYLYEDREKKVEIK